MALGGSDINNQMEELLLHITKLFTGIIYVVGENTTCLKKSNIFTLGVISQRQLAKYMNKVDLGIFAGGTMIHQALCVGLPIIAFPQTKHQSKHVSLWKEFNSVVPIYNLDQFEDAWYYSRCETNRKKLSSIGKQTIDGIGAKKVVREIIEIYCKNYSDCC